MFIECQLYVREYARLWRYNGAQNTVLPQTLLKEVLNFIHANVHDLIFIRKYELNSFCYYFSNSVAHTVIIRNQLEDLEFLQMFLSLFLSSLKGLTKVISCYF